jgi:hypothetical protein
LKALLIAALVFLSTPAFAQERRKPLAFKLGLTCSIAADALDAHSTWYALHDESLGLREGNVLGAYESDSWKKLIAAKIPVGIAVGAVAWHIEEDHPKWANGLLYGNCGLKTAVAIRNYVLTNDQKRKRDAGVALFARLRF